MAQQSGQGFLWTPVFMAVGIAFYFSLAFEPHYLFTVFAWCVGAMFFAVTWRGDFRRVTLFLLCVATGFSLAQLRTAHVYTPILQKKLSPVEVWGTAQSIENIDGGGQRYILSDVKIERLDSAQTPRLVRVKFRGEQIAMIGQRIKVLAGLNPPSPPVLPGGFDFQRFMFFKGIGATGFAFGDAELLEGEQDAQDNYSFEAIRHSVEARILKALPEGQSAIAVALMTGMRGGISEGDNEAMRGSGLAHMLAISGLHIGLFSGFVFFFVRLVLAAFPRVALSYPIKKIAAVCAIFAALFYMFMAGASVPTQRAVLMSTVFFVAIVFDRFPLSLRLVAFAALCVLFIAPEALLSASFQLSFAAVSALVAFYEWAAPYWREMYARAGIWRRACFYIVGVCLTSLIASLSTAPFALFHFQQISLYGILGNVLAMPVLSFLVMPFAFISYAFMLFGLEGVGLKVVGFGVQIILDIAHYVSALEGAVLRVRMWPVSALILLSLAFTFLILLKGRVRFLSIAPLCAGLVVIFTHQMPVFLFSKSAKLAAFYDGDLLSFSTGNKEYFTRDVWLRAYGMPPESEIYKWPKEGEDGAVSCGELGCRISHYGQVIDVLYSQEGVGESCQDVDVVLVQQGLDHQVKCGSAILVDRWDAYRNGAYALYYNGDGAFRVLRSEDRRSSRPWSASHQRRIINSSNDRSE